MAGKNPDDAQLMFSFSHDLRGYLRTMLTRVQLVQTTGAEVLSERDRKFLLEAVAAGRDMDGLIAAMVSYCDAGPSEEITHLGLLLRGLLLETKSLVSETGAVISVTNDSDAAVPAALRAVMKELLINSCRFRRPDRKPDIRIVAHRPDASTLEISVLDNGSGVDPESLDTMFMPFRRMHSRSEYPGHGLGLARCRRIVEAHGGTISAAVRLEGGLAITIAIPVDLPEND